MNTSYSLKSKMLRYTIEQTLKDSKNDILQPYPHQKLISFSGGCCVPLTLSSSLPDFANDFFYPYYIAGNWSQSTLTSTYNGR
jgi:hypothetical protein